VRPLPSIACLLLLGCDQPLPDQPGAGSATSVSVSVEPSAELDAIPAVCRLRIRAGVPLAPDDVVFVQGELSRYYLGRIRDRDLPATLLERVVPHLSWSDDGGVVIAPSVSLTPGARYALATPSDGLVASLTVDESASPPLARLFPLADAVGGTRHAVYCAPEPVDFSRSGDGLLLQPEAVPVAALPGVDARGTLADRCVTLAAARDVAPDRVLAPPPLARGQALDPSPLVSVAPAVPSPVLCGDGQLEFGPACITVDDDRAVVQSLDEGTLWSIVRHDEPFVRAVAPGARFLLGGLSPSSSELLDVELFDLHGNAWAGAFTLVTGAARSHVVINEVMANPLGSEPEQEWVELANDGSAPVDLAGFALADAGGSVTLPSAWLPPGSFALLVREDFVADDGTDVAPPPETALVRVTTLGKNGLSNAGEALELRRPDESVASRFPAQPKPKSGISVARRTSGSLDDDPDAFAQSADPGASPGTPNVLAEP
jgi:Lamin Tail Domain